MIPPWTLDELPFEPTLDDFGFIYQIDYDDGTSYIGKKNIWIYEELPPLKSGKKRENVVNTVNRSVKLTKEELSTRTPTQIRTNVQSKVVPMDVVRKPSAWRSYTGSSALTKNKTIISRIVLATAPTKRYLTYLEVKALLCLNVLEDDKYLNENILGKFFKGNLI